jgi:hypothetical protein
VLVAGQLAHATPSLPAVLAGAAFALAVGVWIRVADL